jgi:hypothetical protein
VQIATDATTLVLLTSQQKPPLARLRLAAFEV